MKNTPFFERTTGEITENDSPFGERLRELRKRKGYTQQQMSKIMDLGLATYGTYETGRYIPDANTIAFLADFFNVTADYLLGLTDSPFFEDEENVFRLDFSDKCLHNLLNISASKRKTRVFEMLINNKRFEELLIFIDTYLLFSEKLEKSAKEQYQDAYKRATRIDISFNNYLSVDAYPDGGVKVADVYLSLMQENLKSILEDMAKKNKEQYKKEMLRIVSEESAKS